MSDAFPPRDQTAGTCANWHRISRSRGQCEQCGVAWQDFEVSCYFRCPHWHPTPSSSAFGGQANNDPTRQDRGISGRFAGERGGNLPLLHSRNSDKHGGRHNGRT